jgi:diketogulonate reductase-like aldo/keto reductase
VTIPTMELKSGYAMPVLGLGTWQLRGKKCERAVGWALEMGYTHIDTSDDYSNEERIGEAIKGFDRSHLFITSKVDDSRLHRRDLMDSCRGSLDRLGIDYLDLYLVHRPNPTIPIEETMQAMSELVKRNMVRSVGISNFNIAGTRAAIKVSGVPVCVNQIKIHPYHYPADAVDFCHAKGIKVTAYSPLDTGGVVHDDMLTKIGKRYGKSAAQTSLRWLLERDLIVIPKASSKKHLSENINVFDWNLSTEDFETIAEYSTRVLRG